MDYYEIYDETDDQMILQIKDFTSSDPKYAIAVASGKPLHKGNDLTELGLLENSIINLWKDKMSINYKGIVVIDITNFPYIETALCEYSKLPADPTADEIARYPELANDTFNQDVRKTADIDWSQKIVKIPYVLVNLNNNFTGLKLCPI